MPRARQIEKKVRVAGANYTDEASLKHTNTLITVDRDAFGRVAAIGYSVRRVSEYSSSLRDLNDLTRKGMGCSPRDRILLK